MFEPIVAVGSWLWSLIPRDIRSGKPRFNYLMVHYLYLIGMSIAGSIILFGADFIPYNDSLFFAVGSATQSGLNTINVNNLLLYQQVVIMLISCVTNPIFINTMVVFVRLYWFEKRFKHIVEEIRAQRRARTPTISQTRSQMREDKDKDVEAARGVDGREIRVLHETTKPNGMNGARADSKEEQQFKEKMGLDTHTESVTPTPEESNKSSHESGEGTASDETSKAKEESDDIQQTPLADSNGHASPRPFHRDIMFADEVQTNEYDEQTPEMETGDPRDGTSETQEHFFAGATPSSENDEGMGNNPAEQTSSPDRDITTPTFSKHIEFLKRQQRNVKEGTTLRIPGPRDFERGEKPKRLDDDELHRPQTKNTLKSVRSELEREGTNTEGEEQLNADDHTQRGVTFNEEEHPAHRQNSHAMERSHTTQTITSRVNRMRSGLHLRRPRSNPNLSHTHEPRPNIGRTFSNLSTALSRERIPEEAMPYLSWQATTGRNSAFLGLTEAQREELGGIEYRALKTLAKILICYFIGFHLSGLFVNLPFILCEKYWRQKVEHYSQNPTWWAIFTSASLFNDLGMTLTPNSMDPFKTSTLVLLYGSFLIIIGNTGFPIMLRFVIWACSLIASHGSPWWEELRFLLDHPRRCFVLLFPSKATWWLFWILVLLNGADLVFYIVLDLHDPVVTDVAAGYRVLDGWFQATSTRTAGFSVVSLYYLHPAIQVSYLIMMYISVFPIAISVRRTNVYEEKSLGIFSGEEEGGDDENQSYVGQHLRRQLSFDLWFIFLGLFIIAIVEGDRISNTNDYAFTMFSVLFEIVSAYGTVGLSLGYPGTEESFSAQFKILSKLVICAMMLRGRHRGLPYALDRAILLPSEHLQKKEGEDADRRNSARRGSLFAEGNEIERQRTAQNWSDVEIDEYGLPKQHIISPHTVAQEPTRTTTADHDLMQEPTTNTMRRRGSGLSTASKHRRRRSLSGVIAGGLGAGPSISKYD